MEMYFLKIIYFIFVCYFQELMRRPKLMKRCKCVSIYTGLDKQKNQRKVVNIFLPIVFSLCFGCSKEPSH